MGRFKIPERVPESLGTGREARVGGEFRGGAEGCKVACGDGEELRSESRADAGDTLNDVRLVVATEAFGDLFVESFDLVVEVEELAGQAGDELLGGRFRLHGNGLLLGGRERFGDHVGDGRPSYTELTEMDTQLVGARGADCGWGAVAGEQSQTGAGGVVEGALEVRKDAEQQCPEAVDSGHPLTHEICTVSGQKAELGHDIVRCGDGRQVTS